MYVLIIFLWVILSLLLYIFPYFVWRYNPILRMLSALLIVGLSPMLLLIWFTGKLIDWIKGNYDE